MPPSKESKSSGFALIYMLLTTTVILLLVGGLISMTQQQLYLSSITLQNQQADYAAQAGLADAISNLEAKSTWTDGFTDKPLVDGTATYSLHFANSGRPGKLISVNNLNNATAADSYLGPKTVPPYTALLIVDAHQNSYQKTIEALVGGGTPVLNDFATSTSGSIYMEGAVSIYGLDSIGSATSLPAGLHSNSVANGPQITWAPLGSGVHAYVSGDLSSSSSDPASINFAGTVGTDYFIRSKIVGAPQVSNPHYDIPNLVRAKSGATDPLPLSPGATGVVTLAAGDHYYNGNQHVAGDIVMQPGSNLYVEGNLIVSGSISGSGVVVVTGRTAFYGSSSITTSETDYVALLSQGHVRLEGFDGTSYLNQLAASSARGALAGDPTGRLAADWARSQLALTDLQNRISLLAGDSWQNSSAPDPNVDKAIDLDQIQLSMWNTPNSATGSPDSNDYLGVPLDQVDSLGGILHYLPTSGSSASFMSRRISLVRDLLRPTFTNSQAQLASQTEFDSTINAFTAGTYAAPGAPPNDPFYSLTYGGIFDMVESNAAAFPQIRPGLEAFYNQLANAIHLLNFNRVGAATFQGIVYTNGGVLADHEVNIVGGLIAEDNGTQRAAEYPSPQGTVTVQPGEVHFQDGTCLTYIYGMFRNGSHPLVNAGILAPLSWHVR